MRERILSVALLEREDFVNAMLGIDGGTPEDEPLPRGAVPYLPCAVEDILVLASELRADDELVDLGSGLGRVVMLAHLLSGARAHGIEIQPRLVARAREIAARLSLDVTFAHGDASETPLDGSVFFLYSPFNGAMMERVLTRLREVAARRPLRICAVGVEFREIDWLVARPAAGRSVVFYDARLGAWCDVKT